MNNRVPWQNIGDDIDTLRDLKLPKPQGNRHKPYRHLDLLLDVFDGTDRHGLIIEKCTFWIQHAPNLSQPVDKFLAKLDIEEWDKDKPIRRSIGIRNSNDQTWSAGGIAGHDNIICSNGMFVGEYKSFNIKHTTYNFEGVGDKIFDGLQAVVNDWQEQEGFISKMQRCHPLSSYDVPSALFDIINRMDEKILPDAKFPELVDLTVRPPYDVWEPCSLWAMHNAFTELLKCERSPNKPLRSRHLNKAFDLHIQDFPSYLDHEYAGNFMGDYT